MVELVFVIVILGILAAVAIPKLAVTRDDAVFVKGKSQISAIRSGIATVKSQRLLQGTTPFIPPYLEGNATVNSANSLFSRASDNNGISYNILEYPIVSGSDDGEWSKDNSNANPAAVTEYTFHMYDGDAEFEYDPSTGQFNCVSGPCTELTQ